MKKFFIIITLFSLFWIFVLASNKKCITFMTLENENLPISSFNIKINGKKFDTRKIVKIMNSPRQYSVALLGSSGVAKNFGNSVLLVKRLVSKFLFEDTLQMYLSTYQGVRVLIPETSNKLEIEKKLYNFLPYMLFDGVFERNFKNISPLKGSGLNPLENSLLTLSRILKNRDPLKKSCILIFTDGTLKIDLKKIKNFFKNPVPVFFIYISDRNSKNFQSVWTFSNIGGGKVFYIPSHSLSLPSISNAINFFLENSYNFQIDLDKYNGKKLKIVIKNRKDKNLKIIYPHFILK